MSEDESPIDRGRRRPEAINEPADEAQHTNSDDEGEAAGLDPDTQRALGPGELQRITDEHSDNEFFKALQCGYTRLLAVVYDRYYHYHGSLKGVERESFIRLGLNILGCIPTPILEAVVAGNLYELSKTDARVRSTLRKFKERSREQPTIYQRLLVDKTTGLAPTPNELLQIIDSLCQYDVDDDLAKSIDSSDDGEEWEGRKCELDTGDRAGILETFCDAAMQVLASLPQESMDRPYPVPWRYFGFSVDLAARKDFHDSHTNSSWMMMLVEDTCRHHFGEKYSMVWHVVGLINMPEEAAPAEVIFSIIGSGYWYTGRGLAITGAGSSNLVARVTEEAWETAQIWALEHTPLLKNMEYQEQLQKETKELLQEIDTLDKQLEEINRMREKRAVLQQIDDLERKQDTLKKYSGYLEAERERKAAQGSQESQESQQTEDSGAAEAGGQEAGQ